MEFLGTSAIFPRLHEKEADQLSKNLTHLRCRYEIASDRICAHVIAAFRIAERDLHILRNGDRALRANEAEYLFLQRAHALAGIGLRSAHQNKNAAAAHIGRLKS